MGKIKIIVAAANNDTIGVNNDLPWHLPTDLTNFKELTTGEAVLMGRKCWDSLPEKFRPLPNRTNVILSRSLSDSDKEVYLNSMDEAIEYCKDRDVFVIGGAEIYKLFFPLADEVYLTRIHQDVEGDVKLEGFNKDEWTLVDSSETINENGFTFNFEVYNKTLTYNRLVEIFSKF